MAWTELLGLHQNYRGDLCVDEMEHPDVSGSAESGLSESATQENKQQKTNKVEQQVCKCVKECVALW